MTSTRDPRLVAGAPLPSSHRDVVVVGGGQAALALGYHLSRALRGTDATLALLDDQPGPGGAWRRAWDSLRLFSPAEWSSLPGYLLPRHLAAREADAQEYPHRDDVLDYLAAYEARYELPVWRPVRVEGVRPAQDALRVETDRGSVTARAVVCATGTASQPFVPDVPGRDGFAGVQLHSSAYRSPAPLAGQRVLVVGGGNSGAQIAAELSEVADVLWSVEREPRFLPSDVDGRVLFDAATARYHAIQNGEDPGRPYSLGDVVQVPSVRAARQSGGLGDVRPPVVSAHRRRRRLAGRDGGRRGRRGLVHRLPPGLGFLDSLGVVGADGRAEVEGHAGGRRAPAVARRLRAMDGVCLGHARRCRPLGTGDGPRGRRLPRRAMDPGPPDPTPPPGRSAGLGRIAQRGSPRGNPPREAAA